jgi:hypothetical protein
MGLKRLLRFVAHACLTNIILAGIAQMNTDFLPGRREGSKFTKKNLFVF